MRIAVIGAGGVGRAIAGRLAESGEDVALGVRDPAGTSAAAVRGSIPDGVVLESIPSALTGAEVVIVAIPGDQIPAFISGHADELYGRVVIDATNDLGAGHHGRMHHVADWQRGAPATQLFRAFNTMGWENFAAPQFDGVPADLFFCGPADGRERVERVIRAVGLRPVHVGDIDTADILDAVARLWFTLAFAGGRGRRLAFRMLGGDGA